MWLASVRAGPWYNLHPANCLIARHEVCPIDFSLCGFSYFLFDLGTSMGSLSVSLRQPLLEGYRRQRDMPDNAIRLIEAFFIISRMSSYGFALPDPDQHAWLQRRIPQVVETICQPFLRGETFLFAAR
jgi:Ser/Thr protein kinase RdoA (MazF antagonist)